MNSSSRYTVICFIARQCGVNLLQSLVSNPNIRIATVFTHSKKPSTEDAARGERPEFEAVQRITKQHAIPLRVINTVSEARALQNFDDIGSFDFLLSLSWRFLVSKSLLGQSKLADINLHRGLLPQYGGAEPVRRMLEDGLKQATITAHIMEETIDTGEILHEDHLSMRINPGESLPEAVERIKRELDPIYPHTAFMAMNKILSRRRLPLLDLPK